MSYNSLTIYLLALSLMLPGQFCATVHSATAMAKSVKTLMQSTAKSGYLTAMTCWNSDALFKFYVAFNDVNRTNVDFDHQITITNTMDASLPEQLDHHSEFILIDLQCNNSFEILLNADNKLNSHYWIVLNMDATQLDDIEDRLWSIVRNLNISPKTEFFYMRKEKMGNSFEVQQFYRIGMARPMIVENFGRITNDVFIDYRDTPITSRRRSNLCGLKLNASMVITDNDTLNHLTDYRQIQRDPLSKVNYKFTQFLMSYLNATAEYSVVSTWGYRDDKTGEWSGMVGQLVRNEVELGASPLFMTVERVSIIQYIVSPTPTGSRFVFRSPKLSYTDNVFLLPFDNLVWICLIGLVTVTTFFLIMSIFVEWKYVFKEKSLENRPKIDDLIFIVFGATCQQGTHWVPQCTAARIIMVVAFTILMFLYTSYSANIVALLQSPSTRIKTLKDLYESRLEIGVDDTVFNRYYFSHAEEPIRKSLYQERVLKKNGRDNFMSLEEGVRRVRKGLFAFHMELALGYKLMSETFFEDEKCGLTEIAFLQVTDPWYAIKKNSSYGELFKIGLMRIHEHGLSDRENIRMYTKKPRCIGHTGNFVTASLVDTKPALLVLILGYSIAFTELLLEFSIRYIQNKMKAHPLIGADSH